MDEVLRAAMMADQAGVAVAEPATDERAPVRTPARAKPTPRNDDQPERLPPYAVVLHNDDVNTFEHVIRTLKKVFGYNTAHAFLLAVRAHRSGRAVVWSGQKEHAEFKADQVRSCGPDPVMRHRGACALGVSIEPMA